MTKLGRWYCKWIEKRRNAGKGAKRLRRGLATAMILLCSNAWGFTTEASYYTLESCLREGTSGIMANGRRLDDKAFTAASWDYRFGTRLKVKRGDREIVVIVTDRGPSKRLYRAGRKLDLSRAAFRQLAPLNKGVIKVTVEEI